MLENLPLPHLYSTLSIPWKEKNHRHKVMTLNFITLLMLPAHPFISSLAFLFFPHNDSVNLLLLSPCLLSFLPASLQPFTNRSPGKKSLLPPPNKGMPLPEPTTSSSCHGREKLTLTGDNPSPCVQDQIFSHLSGTLLNFYENGFQIQLFSRITQEDFKFPSTSHIQYQ